MSTTPLETLDLVVGMGEFIQLRPELVRALGGEPDAAIVLTLVKWRLNPEYAHTYKRGDHFWWCASMPDLAERTGLTVGRVRRALDKLVKLGMIYREQHFLKNAWDKANSYRLASPEDPESLENIDLSPAADQVNTDLSPATDRETSIGRPQQIELSSASDLLSVKTQRQIHNTDSVDDEIHPNVEIDKSGPFRLTPAREKLVTDAMTAAGQAHSVPAYLHHLEMQTWGTAEREIKTWIGIAQAMAHGKNNRRDDVNELLASAVLPLVDDASWQAMLADHSPGPRGHGAGCHYDELSGRCGEHALRIDDEETPS